MLMPLHTPLFQSLCRPLRSSIGTCALLVAICAATLAPVSTSRADTDKPQPVVCMLPVSNDNPRAQVTVRHAATNAKAQNAKLVVHNEKHNSLDEQFATFKKMVGSDCDAIILEPHRPSAVTPAFAQLINQTITGGIPVVSILSDVKGANFTSHITIDPLSVGDHLARATCKRVTSGDTVFHLFPHYRNADIEAMEKSAIKEFNMQVSHQCPGVKFINIESQHPRDVAPAIQAQLNKGEKPALIVTDHPLALTEIIAALKSRYQGSTNNIKLVGFDASPAAVRALKEGTVDSLVVAKYKQYSEQGVIAAVLGTQQINLGKIHVPLTEMTQKNVDDYKEFYGTH
ncbi:MAG: substrate-binding domain-containing protein [Pseudomonadota bacterium]